MASSATIHRRPPPAEAAVPNPLPPLLRTPAGLALLELQGTINLPDFEESRGEDGQPSLMTTSIGHLDFPDYRPGGDPADTAWMRRVHLNVGPYQRLIGEVKKLPRPIAVVQRGRPGPGNTADGEGDQLEVVEIVHYKLQFSQRPEPMTSSILD